MATWKNSTSDFATYTRIVCYAALILTACYLMAFFDGERVRQIVFDRGLIPHIILAASAWALAILLSKFKGIRNLRQSTDDIETFNRKNYERFLSVARYAHSARLDTTDGKCPQCGYLRQAGDEKFFSPLECPKCGAVYKKVAEFLEKQEAELRGFLDQLPESKGKKRVSQMFRDCVEVSADFALKRAEILSDLDAQDAANSYRISQVLAWAVPMLGFLGTVWGIAQSLGNFTGIMGNVNDISQIKESLGAITGGLGVAFDTTLLGIFFALIITGFMAYLQRRENTLLDQFDRTVLNLLKTLSIREKQPQQSTHIPNLKAYTEALTALTQKNQLNAEERKILTAAAQSVSSIGTCVRTLNVIAHTTQTLVEAVRRLDKSKEFPIVENFSKGNGINGQ